MTNLCTDMTGVQKPNVFDINKTIVHNLVPALLPKFAVVRHHATASLHPATSHGTSSRSAFGTYGHFTSETQRYWGQDVDEPWDLGRAGSAAPRPRESSRVGKEVVPLVEDLAHLCGHHNYKFLDVKAVPQVTKKATNHPHSCIHKTHAWSVE
jgi:hypothetical protein